MHLGLPNWHYAFTQVGLDPQTLQWFRFLSPERLAIDIENRRSLEEQSRKKNTRAMTAAVPGSGPMSRTYINEKIKVEGLKRKKRRMRLKAKNQNENAIERFVAQSSKSAKYAKTTVKKRDASASADPSRKMDAALASAAANMASTSGSASQAAGKQISNSNNNSS